MFYTMGHTFTSTLIRSHFLSQIDFKSSYITQKGLYVEHKRTFSKIYIHIYTYTHIRWWGHEGGHFQNRGNNLSGNFFVTKTKWLVKTRNSYRQIYPLPLAKTCGTNQRKTKGRRKNIFLKKVLRLIQE